MVDKELINYLDKNFNFINKKFDEIDKRFDGIDERFNGIDERFDGIDKKFNGYDKEFKSIKEKFNDIDERFDTMDKKFDCINEDLKEIHNDIRELNQSIAFIEIDHGNKLASIFDYMVKHDEADLKYDNHFQKVDKILDNHSIRLSVIEDTTIYKDALNAIQKNNLNNAQATN